MKREIELKQDLLPHALRPIIEGSSNVLIMGHKVPDMDAYGSAIGIYRAVINRGKDAYIVLNGPNESIRNIHGVFSSKEEYKFISSEEALEMIEKDTLLIIVDTNRPSFTECPELLNKSLRTVVIDHHRMGTEFVEKYGS